ncbi:hypothetical protein [Natrononativus amylolyticus]|uniref:hypothetical protein n=1 Tax=Natrononativus amylolyticus TaxID=2963434 RepID=UPI0020CDEBB5|nr:hypothetical protein [Natrononativus amylolyticus]
MTDDPSAIRSFAVSPEDVVDAFVYGRENPGTAVLRVTPPFHGRMRARLHVYHTDDREVTGAIHLEPRALLPEDVRAAYPTLDAGAADVDAARERHEAAIDDWRTRARESVVDRVELDAGDGNHAVDVKRLG